MAAPPPARRPSALMDELVEEILLRVPPDDPASLARAAVVCKHWCRLITNPGFRRRFRQLHRTPPLLGFVVIGNSDSDGTHFLPCSSFRPSIADCGSWCPVDARHGRILFYDHYLVHDPDDWTIFRINELIVWTPATGGVRELPKLWLLKIPSSCWNAALLCAAPGCDHMECPSGGPFNVILVGRSIFGNTIYAYVLSSEDDEWIETATIELPGFHVQRSSYSSSAFVRNTICFLLEDNKGILEYNLAKKELSVIMLPPICNESSNDVIVLMKVEDNGLGFAMVHDFSLRIWLRESVPTPSGGWTWTQHRAVDIKSFLPVSALSFSPHILATADAVGVFVIWAVDAGVLAIDLKSKKVRKVSDDDDTVVYIIPFISFCTPASRATSINEEPSTSASTYTGKMDGRTDFGLSAGL